MHEAAFSIIHLTWRDFVMSIYVLRGSLFFGIKYWWLLKKFPLLRLYPFTLHLHQHQRRRKKRGGNFTSLPGICHQTKTRTECLTSLTFLCQYWHQPRIAALIQLKTMMMMDFNLNMKIEDERNYEILFHSNNVILADRRFSRISRRFFSLGQSARKSRDDAAPTRCRYQSIVEKVIKWKNWGKIIESRKRKLNGIEDNLPM